MKATAAFTPIALAVAVGATTPAPSGGEGSLIWSTTANSVLVWDGSQWARCAAGDVAGPASATDNAIARFDGATGKALQNSAATVDDGGAIRSAIDSGANPVSVPLVNWLQLSADYTLTSTTSPQKLFNTTTNGRLTLPTGIYRLRCGVRLDTMSGTSGNGQFDFLGAGTATIDRIHMDVFGKDGSLFTIGAYQGQSVAASASAASIATAATSTQLSFFAEGIFRVSAGGTVIPSFALTNAAAAVVKAGSYFIAEKIGESAESYLGAWT